MSSTNILRIYAQATEEQIRQGLSWYDDARGVAITLSREYGVRVDVAAGVIAALSPSNKWGRNCVDAANLIAAHAYGASLDEVKVSTYGAMKKKGKGRRGY